MDTNVKAVFFLTQRMLPLLEAAATAERPARVINIGSIDGIKTPVFETMSYGPSKAALHTMTRQLGAHLVGRHIIVNAIAPGPFPTWMLSTGVGGGGDVDNTDWDAVGRTQPEWAGRHARGHRRPRHLPRLAGRRVHRRRGHHLRRRHRRPWLMSDEAARAVEGGGTLLTVTVGRIILSWLVGAEGDICWT